MSSAISVREVGKRYLLYDRPQDRLKQSLLWRLGRNYAREFWALRNVSFEVPRGQSLGIIGRNGSGKSTLLQIVAGTVQPTTGTVAAQGRVSALLELGAGFNPEFTGRENVYMNGAILGFSRQDMDERFDAIAAFADIGEFMDQPVKIYSSGMYVRLAFAVATTVEPDILIVDEALAVGDAYFQQRCMRWMRQFKESGNTFVFVTHDPATIKSLCDQAIWLNSGQIAEWGDSERVVSRYLAHLFGQTERPVDIPPSATTVAVAEPVQDIATGSFTDLSPETNVPNVDRRFGDGRAEILGVSVYDERGDRTPYIVHGHTTTVRISAVFRDRVARPCIGFTLRDRIGQDIASNHTEAEGVVLPTAEAGDVMTVSFRFDMPWFQPGPYSLSPSVADIVTPAASVTEPIPEYTMCDWIDNALVLHIVKERYVDVLMRLAVACNLDHHLSNSWMSQL